MLSSAQVYPLVAAWLHQLEAIPHRTACAAVADRLTALLLGQSLRPSVLLRACPSPTARPARAGSRQVAAGWQCPWLTAAVLTPALVRAALRLSHPVAPVLVLDSLRCGRWEVFTLGLVWHGRVLPVSWAMLPYPWPTGQFTPTVCALIKQVAAVWPPTAPPPHFLADRAFPSKPLFATLAAVGWGFTVRLRASDMVTVDSQDQSGRDLIMQATAGVWTCQPGTFGDQHLAVATQVVVGRSLPVLPWHQRDDGSARHRARRARRKLQDAKQSGRAAPTAPWVVLLTTHAGWRAAVGAYAQRYHTEGTYRDWQTGWDGRHGWDLGEQVARVAADRPARVAGLVGLAALGTLVQSWLGHQLTAPSTPAAVRAEVAGWTVHGRLSVWARGRLALTDATGRLDDWVRQTLAAGAGALQRDRCAAPRAPTTRRRPAVHPCPHPVTRAA